MGTGHIEDDMKGLGTRNRLYFSICAMMYVQRSHGNIVQA
jgi:hypothetical protein